MLYTALLMHVGNKSQPQSQSAAEKPMDLAQLKQFEAIARLGTVSAAAEELHLSQPAVSRSIGRLERELGCQL